MLMRKWNEGRWNTIKYRIIVMKTTMEVGWLYIFYNVNKLKEREQSVETQRFPTEPTGKICFYIIIYNFFYLFNSIKSNGFMFQ